MDVGLRNGGGAVHKVLAWVAYDWLRCHRVVTGWITENNN